jgi:hypothetical protein
MITVLAFPEVTDVQDDDYFYSIRGSGTTRDKKIRAKNLIGQATTVTGTDTVDLSTFNNNLTIFCNSATPITLTISNALPENRELKILNVNSGVVTLATLDTISLASGSVQRWISDGTSMYFTTNEIFTDTIKEQTPGNGVTIDGSLIKDGDGKFDTISEKTSSNGVTIDGVLLKDGKIDNVLYPLFWDYIVTNTSELEALNTAGPTYKRVLVRKGTYSPSADINLDTCNVEWFIGEGDVTITSPLVRTTKPTTNLHLYKTENIFINLTSGNRGIYRCVNLKNCKINISSDALDHRGFYQCDYIEKCEVNSDGGNGGECYRECNFINNSTAYQRTTSSSLQASKGFIVCNYITNCEVSVQGGDSISDSGFESCNYLCNIVVKDSLYRGVVGCSYISNYKYTGTGSAQTSNTKSDPDSTD